MPVGPTDNNFVCGDADLSYTSYLGVSSFQTVKTDSVFDQFCVTRLV